MCVRASATYSSCSSKAVSMKVERASRGLVTNINVGLLWERAPLDVAEWDKYLSLSLADAPGRNSPGNRK